MTATAASVTSPGDPGGDIRADICSHLWLAAYSRS